MIRAAKEESPHSPKGRKPFLFLSIAGSAIFLLLFSGINGIANSSRSTVFTPGTTGYGSVELRSGKAVAYGAPELVLVEAAAVRASFPPITATPQVLGALLGSGFQEPRPEVVRYAVEEGDTVFSVAEKFSVSANTIAWANDLSQNSSLKPGAQIVILPVSGAMHLVRPHDTLSEIAAWYKGDIDDIAEFNQLDSAQEIFAGDLLIIPDGVQPRVVPSGRLTPLPNSYFIYPIPAPYRVTQGLHPYNAIDFGNAVCGEQVYAAAGGTIQKTGYDRTGGNFVRILHPNGVVTYYGHLSRILVVPGARVFQGQIIGNTGHTGYTIPAGPGGCHLHFEVRGARNPFL